MVVRRMQGSVAFIDIPVNYGCPENWSVVSLKYKAHILYPYRFSMGYKRFCSRI